MSNVQPGHNANDAHPEPSDGRQWQKIEILETRDPETRALEVLVSEQFPREAAVLSRSGMSRRQFISLMGASLAMGGLSLTGCTPARREHESILPYARQPEEIVPGKPLFFASTMVLGGYATGVLIATRRILLLWVAARRFNWPRFWNFTTRSARLKSAMWARSAHGIALYWRWISFAAV